MSEKTTEYVALGWVGRYEKSKANGEKFWVDGGNQIWTNCYECEEEESLYTPCPEKKKPLFLGA